MSEMKLWAYRDCRDGFCYVIRSAKQPQSEGCFGTFLIPSTIVAKDTHGLAFMACEDVRDGIGREIKALDLINWTVEYAPEPQCLKDAWQELKKDDVFSGCVNSTYFALRNLIIALQREFPDA